MSNAGGAGAADAPRLTSWRDIRAELLRRINERIWRPGEPIPHEAALAEEFDCARTTVNRALRDLAERGLVIRKRRAGTRVTLNPPAHVTLRIPIYREEIEAKQMAYRHVIQERRVVRPPKALQAKLALESDAEALWISTLHCADERPYALDQRWINLATAPDARDYAFDAISPNEWLVQNAPYTRGDIAFSAEEAQAADVAHLGVAPGAALLVLDRITWRGPDSVTTTRISFPPDHRILSSI